jgi:hypothetical protein
MAQHTPAGWSSQPNHTAAPGAPQRRTSSLNPYAAVYQLPPGTYHQGAAGYAFPQLTSPSATPQLRPQRPNSGQQPLTASAWGVRNHSSGSIFAGQGGMQPATMQQQTAPSSTPTANRALQFLSPTNPSPPAPEPPTHSTSGQPGNPNPGNAPTVATERELYNPLEGGNSPTRAQAGAPQPSATPTQPQAAAPTAGQAQPGATPRAGVGQPQPGTTPEAEPGQATANAIAAEAMGRYLAANGVNPHDVVAAWVRTQATGATRPPPPCPHRQ